MTRAGSGSVVVAISWAAAVVFAVAGATVVRFYDQAHPFPDVSMQSQRIIDGRSIYCVFMSRQALDRASRWNPSRGPIPLSLEAATAIATPALERMTAGHVVHRSDAKLEKVGMGRRPEEGDAYFYRFEFSSRTGPQGRAMEGEVLVLLDGSLIESTSTGCPVPRFGRGYGFADDVEVPAVLFSMFGFLVLTTLVYAPIAIFLGRRARGWLLAAVAATALAGAAMGLARAYIGYSYPLLSLPSGMEFGVLLGVLPAVVFVNALVTSIAPPRGREPATGAPQ
jgi:hypothetical protein